jgi:inorganic phosphate transporter, PiT family
VNVQSLMSGFPLPLLLSPVLAVLLAPALFIGLRFPRRCCGVTKEWCICVGERQQIVPIPQPVSMASWENPAPPVLEITVGEHQHCEERYAGTFLGVHM